MLMNVFDKVCAVLAFPLGVVLLVLGIIGLFVGCNASFVLPPILGVVPAFVGWGIVRPVVVAWKSSARAGEQQRPLPDELPPMGPILDRPPGDNPYESPRY
jgi:hypothetical protein